MLTKFLVLLAGVATALAVPATHPLLKRSSYTTDEGVEHTVVVDQTTNAKLDFVTNSGVCETTAGVNQYSGYLDVGSGLHMFFWFFEARNNPTTAPLATWFNGGPGCSSMIGLFQENGPCQFYNGASTPSLNKYSFNEYANMLYIDQPVGTGFSYGDSGTPNVAGTVAAAPYVWTLLQAFFKQFPQYESRDFGIFTESYGGHFGSEFASYTESQNSKIASGSVSGEKINLVALGINNGWYDPVIQYQAYIDYAYNNSYNYNTQMANRCKPALQKCTSLTSTSQTSSCENAESTCYRYIEGSIINAQDFDVYDVREPSNDPYPPTAYVNYINSASIRSKIGAKVSYSECSDAVFNNFENFGDDSRSTLSTMLGDVKSNIQILMWAGDADFICNYLGNYNVAQQVAPTGFNSKALQSYTVNGKAAGLFKTQNNFSWLQVYGAGHEVPYYTPAVALQAFKQTMSKAVLTST
nr:carboxypeptidase s1 [Quercus suber]